MKPKRLFAQNVMALCCILGMISKKILNPFANVITEALHIPGGISTGFSIMFLVIGTELVRQAYCGTKMGTVQGFLALALGRVGSMGALSPLGYILPGLAIDLIYRLPVCRRASRTTRMMLANSLAAVTASITANLIVFHLPGTVLWLYLCVSMLCGSLYGILAAGIAARLDAVFNQYRNKAEGLRV